MKMRRFIGFLPSESFACPLPQPRPRAAPAPRPNAADSHRRVLRPRPDDSAGFESLSRIPASRPTADVFSRRSWSGSRCGEAAVGAGKPIGADEYEAATEGGWALDDEDRLQRLEAAGEERLAQETMRRLAPSGRLYPIERRQVLSHSCKISVFHPADRTWLLRQRAWPLPRSKRLPGVEKLADGEVEKLGTAGSPFGDFGDAQGAEVRSSHGLRGPNISS